MKFGGINPYISTEIAMTMLTPGIYISSITDNSLMQIKEWQRIFDGDEVVEPKEGVRNDYYNAIQKLKSSTVKYTLLFKSVKKISDSSFTDCKSIKNVFFWEASFGVTGRVVADENFIKKLPKKCFMNCTELDYFSCPKGLVDIDDQCFINCKKLSKIDLSNSLETIGKSAFEKCYKLSSILFNNPHYIKKIDDSAFSMCTQLRNINLGDTKINKISNGLFINCRSLANITLPITIITLGKYSFSSSGIEKVILPENVKSIGSSAFFNCKQLEQVDLKNVSMLGEQSFSYCIMLSEIFIPSTVTELGDEAFAYCKKLKSVTINSDSPLIVNGKVKINTDGSYESGLVSVFKSVSPDLKIDIIFETTRTTRVGGGKKKRKTKVKKKNRNRKKSKKRKTLLKENKKYK